MYNLPEVSNYGRYSSDNYGVNTLCFTDTKGRDFYFSYKTCVAFRANGVLTVRVNDWSTTTGKHLNWIDGGSKEAKARRVDGDKFQDMLNDAIANTNE